MMERGRQNVLEDGLGRDLMNAGRFCFSCEKIFANRKCLEEHCCSAASYICSCGTEFIEYKDMLDHSTTHEPGHQVLDHGTIIKRRIEKRMKEEEQLKRLETGEVVWQPQTSSLVPKRQLPISSLHLQSGKMPQVPQASQTSLLPNRGNKDMQNIFAGVGAPTVDLWTLYQPVVLLQTMQKYNKAKPYACAKCGQSFLTRASLVSHHSAHVTDKVAGCIGCGLLLSSKKLVPRYHLCKAPKTHPTNKFRIITAEPPKMKLPNETTTVRNPVSVPGPWATSYLQLKNQSPSTDSPAPLRISTMKLQNHKFTSYNKSNQGLRFSPSLQLKSQNRSASRPYIASSLQMMRHSPNSSVSNKISYGLTAAQSVQLRIPVQSASGLLSKPMQTSSSPNGFACRVCHLPFETAQLLQRHKCAKAHEFMAKHVRGKRHFRLKRVTSMTSPYPLQINGERKLGVPVSGNIKKNQVMAVGLDKGPVVPVNGKTGVSMDDDDCYIVESGPDKSAEMIYQVTSSVPIKT